MLRITVSILVCVLSISIVGFEGRLQAAEANLQMSREVATAHLIAQREFSKEASEVSPMLKAGEEYSIRTIELLPQQEDKQTLAYIAHLDPQGYIVVSSDTDITPIIAYSYRSNFVMEDSALNIPLHLLTWDMQNRLDAIIRISKGIKRYNNEMWNSYLDEEPSFLKKVGELATYGPWLDTQWGQSGIYNDSCPLDPGTGFRCVSGCVATAMAQIVNYWEYPNSLSYSSPADDYTSFYTSPSINIDNDASTYDFPSFPTLSSRLSSINYNGNGNNPTNATIADLMFACGVSVKMGYSSSGSGATTSEVATALRNKFGYLSAEVKYPDIHPDFYPTLSANMRSAHPAELAIAIAGLGGGHAIVCDGYKDSEDTYHLNYGWDGSSDGWYSLPTGMPAGYDVVKYGVVNIEAVPTTPSPTPEGYHTPVPTPTSVGQSIPFSEDFEGVWSGGAPELWTKEYVTGTADWIKGSGGLYSAPPSAHGGTYNALLYREDWSGPVTRLISPRIDFGNMTRNARLTFWHAMSEFNGDQDELEVYYRTSGSDPWTLLASYDSSVSGWTERTLPLPNPGNVYYICFQGSPFWGYGICIDDLLVTGEADLTGLVLDGGDYNGDGTSDIAIFRGSNGMWSVRGVTRAYFGSSSDLPVPGDYNGDGATDIGIFRPGSGLWGIRGLTRIYFGSSSDIPVPGDYDGDGTCEVGIFRDSSGLWSIRGVSRAYFGTSGDLPVPGDYDGDGGKEIALFRGSSGLWAIQGLPRVYFGGSSDAVVPGDYNGDGTWEAGIFRGTSGMWAVRDVTRTYYGTSIDQPVPADYNGDSKDDMGIFRSSLGLWGIRNVSRAYFGAVGDVPVTR